LTSNVLAASVILLGLVVMFGWYMGIAALLSIYPAWVTMKFSTAFCFVSSGVSVISHNTNKRSKLGLVDFIQFGSAFWLTTFMFFMTLESMLNHHYGFSWLGVRESLEVQSERPGEPSMSTMFGFVSSGVYLIGSVFGNVRFIKNPIAWFLMGIGGMCLLGYILQISLLYFRIPGFSSAMAFHTGAGFIALGGALSLSKEFEENQCLG